MEKHSPIYRLALVAAVALAIDTAAVANEVCNLEGRVANLDFTLSSLDGNDVTLDDHRGKVILLNFWATWCVPCRVEIPDLVELHQRYRDRGLAVLGVSINDSVARLDPFVRQLGISYPVLIGAGRYDLQEAFGPLVGYPTSFLISRDGVVCVQHTGRASKADLEREIAALL